MCPVPHSHCAGGAVRALQVMTEIQHMPEDNIHDGPEKVVLMQCGTRDRAKQVRPPEPHARGAPHAFIMRAVRARSDARPSRRDGVRARAARDDRAQVYAEYNRNLYDELEKARSFFTKPEDSAPVYEPKFPPFSYPDCAPKETTMADLPVRARRDLTGARPLRGPPPVCVRAQRSDLRAPATANGAAPRRVLCRSASSSSTSAPCTAASRPPRSSCASACARAGRRWSRDGEVARAAPAAGRGTALAFARAAERVSLPERRAARPLARSRLQLGTAAPGEACLFFDDGACGSEWRRALLVCVMDGVGVVGAGTGTQSYL